MKYAIYSRKSRFTGQGDSVQNQVELCKTFLQDKYHCLQEEIIIYEDEGFSGSTTQRPAFQKLLQDLKNKEYKVLICYRIDRISRSVSDFSKLIDLLNVYNVQFISISEFFDTNTPMGRTMLYILSAFAQLERETIAERIKDNMLFLSKTGRWLGGITPTGYQSIEMTYTDTAGKIRKICYLEPIETELRQIKQIYNLFIDLESISKVEGMLRKMTIKSKNNKYYTPSSLKYILTNPVYVQGDQTIYDYLHKQGYTITSSKNEFNGNNGLMAYNKTLQQKHKAHQLKAPSDWIIAIGNHPYCIKSEKWLLVQDILKRQGKATRHRGYGALGLLSGLIQCSECGHFMRPKKGRMSKRGTQLYYYICEHKEKTRGSGCSIKNAQGNKIDQEVIEALTQLPYDLEYFSKHVIKIETHSLSYEPKNTYALEDCINNLLQSIEYTQDPKVRKLLIKEIEKLTYTQDFEDTTLQATETCSSNDLMENLNLHIQYLSLKEQRYLLSLLITRIIWDGENVMIYL